QNAFPGITNKLLGKDAKKVFVAYDTLDKWFDKNKIINTGNPLRGAINIEGIDRAEAFKYYGLDPNKKTIFLTGGSLGARTLNQAMEASLEKFKNADVQLLWQCGKVYEEEFKNYNSETVVVKAFIDRMDFAYALGDIIISRAGGTISELAIIGKPSILVPSPNVAEDHQTKNVMALVAKNATVLVKDKDAIETLADEAISLLKDETKQKELGENIKQFAKPNAADEIARCILQQMKIDFK
ncbi:MAG: UDP-N-acetylglucosamine--N-acetylmuramyl-(pentapeptide) pyrophosphoryl-undecaprenol N-acetylglucosamine transferase, partial [Chitinophagales bacterium]